MVLPSCGSISRIHIGPHVEMVWGADSWHPLLGDWFSGSELNSQSIFLTNAQMILMRQFRLVWNIYSYRLLNFFASQKYDSFFLSGFVFFFFFFGGGGSVETFNIYKQEESTISPFKVLTSFKANNYLPFCFSVSFLRKRISSNTLCLKDQCEWNTSLVNLREVWQRCRRLCFISLWLKNWKIRLIPLHDNQEDLLVII